MPKTTKKKSVATTSGGSRISTIRDEPDPEPSRFQKLRKNAVSLIPFTKANKEKKEAKQREKEMKEQAALEESSKITMKPLPEEGVLTHIPREKAQILHILQEECDLTPEEVFPLYPDPKIQETLEQYETVSVYMCFFLFFFAVVFFGRIVSILYVSVVIDVMV